MPRTSNEERLMALEVKVEQHSVQNNKDFGEVKEGNKEIKKSIHELSEKIDGLDNKYAHKEALEKLEIKFDTHNERQRDNNSWLNRNIFSIIMTGVVTLLSLLTYFR